MLMRVLLTLSVIIIGLAVLLYHPLPAGIEDPFSTQIVVAIFKLISFAHSIRKFLGYGNVYENLQFPFATSPGEGPPKTASYGALQVTRSTIDGIPVIIYQQKDNSRTYPGLIFFHGGGWAFGTIDTYDKFAYNYALHTGTNAISVNYRLAPQHSFPAAAQDCLHVTRYILKHGGTYNIDTRKVGVAGDSAGGNLAAVVALKLSREKSELPPLLFQVLHYPALQAFDLRLPSYLDMDRAVPILSQAFMAALYASYMGIDRSNITYFTSVMVNNRHIPAHLRQSKYAEFVNVNLLPLEYQSPKKSVPAPATGHDDRVYSKIKDIVTNPLFSPLMATDLTGLPPTFIHVCEFDVLRDDGLLYAKRLQDAGVKVHTYKSKGGYHGDSGISTLLYSTSGSKSLSAAFAFVQEIIKK